MFEKYIDECLEKNFSLFADNDDIIKFGHIFSVEGVSRFILQYFEAELKWLIFKEKINIQSDINLSADSGDIQLDMFKKSLFSKLMIYKDDLRERVVTSVKIHFNYMIRPLFTIEKFIFENSFAKSAEEIQRRLDYLRGYPNLRDVADNYLSLITSENKYQPVSRENFMRVVQDADRAFFMDVDALDLYDYLEPMFECFQSKDGEIGVPIEAFLIYFDDKNNSEIFSFLLNIRSEKKLRILNPDDIRIVLNDLVLFIEERNQTDDKLTGFEDDEENSSDEPENYIYPDVPHSQATEKEPEAPADSADADEQEDTPEVPAEETTEPESPEPILPDDSPDTEGQTEIPGTPAADDTELQPENDTETASGPEPRETEDSEEQTDFSAQEEKEIDEEEEDFDSGDDGFDDIFEDMSQDRQVEDDDSGENNSDEDTSDEENPAEETAEEHKEEKSQKNDSDDNLSDDDLLAMAEQILKDQ